MVSSNRRRKEKSEAQFIGAPSKMAALIKVFLRDPFLNYFVPGLTILFYLLNLVCSEENYRIFIASLLLDKIIYNLEDKKVLSKFMKVLRPK